MVWPGVWLLNIKTYEIPTGRNSGVMRGMAGWWASVDSSESDPSTCGRRPSTPEDDLRYRKRH